MILTCVVFAVVSAPPMQADTSVDLAMIKPYCAQIVYAWKSNDGELRFDEPAADMQLTRVLWALRLSDNITSDTNASTTRTNVSLNDAIMMLHKFSYLHRVSICSESLSPRACASLSMCRSLQVVEIESRTLSSECVSAVSSLRGIRGLTLRGCKVTSDDCKRIAANNIALEYLDLSTTNADDQCIANISNLNKLSKLYINSTPITESIITSLSQMKSLRHLEVVDTALDDDAVSRLTDAKPDIYIKY